MGTSTDPLVVGATRPTMMWGVSYEALLVCSLFTAVVFIGSGNIFTLLVYVPMHVVCYLICLKDPRAFRLLKLWLQTKGRSLSRRYWGASSATPLANTRNRKRMGG